MQSLGKQSCETRPQKNSTRALVVGRPNVVDEEGFLEDVKKIIDTRLFTNCGPYSEQLEKNIEEYLGVKHCVAVSNATVGLELVMRALDLEPGSEVIVPSYTFIATVHAIKSCGLVPRFCDVDAKTHLITVDHVSACLSPKTAAIIGVHLWGLCCGVEGLTILAEAHNLILLFDAAHAFGSRNTEGVAVGNFGKAEVFSMHATKLFNSFEGGLITTNDRDFALKVSRMRNFGICGQDVIGGWGTNVKLSEVHAAFALRQLNGIEKLLRIYGDNASAYCDELKEVVGIDIWNERYLSHEGCTHSYICVEVTDDFSMTRDQLMAELRKESVYGKRYFYPGAHRCKPYASEHIKTLLPNTERLCTQVLVLPTGTCISSEDIQRIVSLIKQIYATGVPDRLAPVEIVIDESSKSVRLSALEQERSLLLERLKCCDMEIESLNKK